MANNCAFCDEDDNDEMVQCDSCDKWVHYVCAGVTNDVKDKDFVCKVCHEKEKPADMLYETPVSTKTSTAAHGEKQVSEPYKCGSHDSLKKKRFELELLKLEESRKIELEAIEKKFALLRGYVDEDEFENFNVDALRISEVAKPIKINKDIILPQQTNVINNFNNDNNLIQFEQPKIESTTATSQNSNILNLQQLSTRHAVPRDLPTFTGKPDEWLVFYSNFENSTRMCGFTDDENLLRLQRALKGKALECVSSKLMIPAMVPEIMATLKMVFGRPDQIINNIMSKLRMQPSVNANKLDTIISFALELKNLTASMAATGLESYYHNPMLVQELVEKLPPSMRMDWGKYRGKNNIGNLKQLSDWLYDQAETASTVSSVSSFQNADADRRKVNRINFHGEEKKIEHDYQKSLACYGCGKNHMFANCESFIKAKYDDKWQQVKLLKLCYTCLKKHNSKFCKDRTHCGINGCTKKHHRLLHKPDVENNIESELIASHHQETSHMLYRIIPITVFGNGTSCDIYAFLDDGSGPTLIEQDVLQLINVKGEKKDLCLKWTDGSTRIEKGSNIINLSVSQSGKPEKTFMLNNVRSVRKLDLPSQTLNMEELTHKYKHLCGLPVKSYKNVVPKMIIGVNNKGVAMPLKYREGQINEPAATKTRLGWTIYGSLDDKIIVDENMQFHICECDDDIALQALVVDSMKVEEMNHDNKQQSIKAQTALQKVVKLNQNYYVTKLLWKTDNMVLPDNYNMALQRLKCFEKKLSKNSELKCRVDEHMMDMLNKGYIRKLSPNEIVEEHSRIWYLPVFTVQNPNKPKKVRIVWDAAAKHNGISLNDCLDKGPDMLNSLIGVLFNFRTGKIGVCGDICEMFHRVHVDEEDQQSQRFLWRKNERDNPDVYVLCVLSFGASCSPALAQYVKNTNAMRYIDKLPRAVKSIIERHYVDDMLDSVDTIEEAIILAKEVKEIHSNGNFHIRNWLSNSNKVIEALGEKGEPNVFCSAGKRVEQFIEPSKVLGMWWETEDDVFTFNLKFTKANDEILRGLKLPTKRQLLRLLMSIFDPLGLLTYYLVNIKILFQKIWRCGIDWDDEIPKEFEDRWKRWLLSLPNVKNIKVPRHYFGTWKHKDCDIQLHVFVDASDSAYAAVAYFRYQYDNLVKVSLIGSKSKVAPLRPVSIPRMELMAAVMGVRFAETIIKHHDLKIKNIRYWSDSKTVLAWIKSEPTKYKQFVMFRIGEIQETTAADQWSYVPTKLNVADLATKITLKPEIDPNSEWFRGPSFLQQPSQYWPKQRQETSITDDEELKVKKETYLVAYQTEIIQQIIDVKRFSKWERMINCLAYVKLFIENVKNKVIATKEKRLFKKQTLLTDIELKWSHNQLCKLAQEEKFEKEIKTLKNNGIISKNSCLRKLSPFIDENQILRMRSRIENANFVDNDRKYKILLPKNHIITKLLVDWYHRKFKHSNHETIINEIFQKYQIPNLRNILKSVRHDCHSCRVRDACPKPPEMGQLPVGRLSPFCRPFTHVGVDFFGPFLTVIGRRTEKRYGVVFTCLTCRAVHLEMAYSLTMSSCIVVIRNFIARRGMPRVFYSDNGTNLKASEKELSASLSKIKFDDLQLEFTGPDMKWTFIPPASPHMGGSWERMVRTIKNVMYRIITPETKINDEKLNNLLIEVEHIVNSRPLTYLSLDTAEQEALTPNHFLLGSSNGSKPPGAFDSRDQYVKGSWRHSQYLADMFWKRWVAEMLPTLTKRTKWYEPADPLQEGDVVIIVDPNSPRYSWPKGIIIKAISGKDGQTRSALVRTAQGQYHRPTTKLAKLDIKNIINEVAK